MTTATLGTLPVPDLISTAQLGSGDVLTIFETAKVLKQDRDGHRPLEGQKLAMLFEKESMRTRFTFDIGIQELGGSAVFLDHRHARIGSRESIADLGRNLERWVDGVVMRMYRHRHIEELAEHCDKPVINGLSDLLHPCQALSDLFTLWERFGELKGRKLTFVGDGNNTCHSLLQTGARLGVHVTVCAPEGYEPNARVLNDAMIAARETGAEIQILEDPKEGVEGADAVYTDVWASMGQEDEIEERASIFHEYQVDAALMEAAGPDALFMHCLPAHRGAEVTNDVMDSERSIVFDIAENRLHVQKAIMAMLMGPKN
ncbi:MAG: ornithine carbamoyltransferase [Planctomycetota bacterium]